MATVLSLLKGKKAVVFTVLSLLMLGSIFILSRNYLQINNDFKYDQNLNLLASKIDYLEDDIVADFFRGLSLVNISFYEENGYIIFNLSGIKINASIDYAKLFGDYEAYIEGIYSDKNNLNIQLIGFFPGFNGTSYITRLFFQSDALDVFTEVDIFVDLYARIKMNRESPETISEDLSSGTTPVHVVILNATDGIVYDKTNNLDMADESEIEFEYENHDKIKFKIGSFEGFPAGTVRVQGNTTADIQDLLFKFTNVGKPIFFHTGNLSISASFTDFSKNDYVYVYR